MATLSTTGTGAVPYLGHGAAPGHSLQGVLDLVTVICRSRISASVFCDTRVHACTAPGGVSYPMYLDNLSQVPVRDAAPPPFQHPCRLSCNEPKDRGRPAATVLPRSCMCPYSLRLSNSRTCKVQGRRMDHSGQCVVHRVQLPRALLSSQAKPRHEKTP